MENHRWRQTPEARIFQRRGGFPVADDQPAARKNNAGVRTLAACARSAAHKDTCDERQWRVVDNLDCGCPVTVAELDAVEAFLMPLVHALLADHENGRRTGERSIAGFDPAQRGPAR
jgi:hypothetical protein